MAKIEIRPNAKGSFVTNFYFYPMKNNAVKYGIVAGILAFFYLMAFYFADKANIFNPIIQSSVSILYLIFMVKAGMDVRKALNLKISFKEVLKPAFTVFVIASVIFFSYRFFLINYFDPELITIRWELGKAEGYSENIEDYKVSFFQLIFGIFQSFIFGFILSAGVAAILKTE